MENSQLPFPKIGYIVETNRDEIVISNSIVFDNSRLTTIPMLRVENGTGQELVKGDRILYILNQEKHARHESITVKKILARNIPVASSVKRFLAEMRISMDCEKDALLDKEKLQHFFKVFVGVSLNFTTEEEASLIVHISNKDEGTSFCRYPPISLTGRIDTIPFRIEVPYVSDKTIRFLHRVSEPTLEDKQLKLAILSLRILHILLHVIGYKEHMELASVAAEYEARIRGDPSLVQQVSDLRCIMSWRSLHLLASTYDASKSYCSLAGSLICESCETAYAQSDSFAFCDLEAIKESIQNTRHSLSRNGESQYRGFCRYRVLYVLGVLDNADPRLLLGVSPIRSRQTIVASRTTGMDELEHKIFNGVGLIVSPDSLERESVNSIEKGDKILVEFTYSRHKNEKRFLLSSIKILGKLSERNRIDDTSSLLHRLGVGRIRLTIRIKWASEVDKTALNRAAEQVRRLTGWKVLVDGNATVQLDSISAKMDSDMKKLKVASRREEIRKIIYDLQDTVGEISPIIEDVVDKPVVIVFILPQFHYMPISTMGHMALGLAKRRLFSVLPMPGRFGPVRFHSETCKECPENYTEGRNYRYSHHLSVLLIHELLHITADMRDHPGECPLCPFDMPEMLPLRFSECEKCIQNDGHYVHRNCLMSYACQLCIASRLTEIENLRDILCDACVSKIRPETEYLNSYFARINQEVYGKLMADIGKKRFEAHERERAHTSS